MPLKIKFTKPMFFSALPLKGGGPTSQEQYGLNGAMGRMRKQTAHSAKRKPAP